MLASRPVDGTRVWALDIDDLLAIARQNVTRSLTERSAASTCTSRGARFRERSGMPTTAWTTRSTRSTGGRTAGPPPSTTSRAREAQTAAIRLLGH
jgi:hypothetical protein